MKKLVLLVLSLTLAGCGAFQPVPTPSPQPTLPPTPQVILATVLVTVIPTQVPADTPAPTETASPTVPPILLTLEAVTDTPASDATLTGTPASGEVEVPASLLGGVFSRIAFSTNRFSLRCEPKTIRFDVTISDMHIRLVEFYYRIRGKTSTFVPDWTRGGTLETDGGAQFWLDYAASDVVPDNRKVDGWFEAEFVGFNNLSQVVG
ncbi:MAG: hypothetical protein AB1750_06580, partial [Chloroflexota bacterium]